MTGDERTARIISAIDRYQADFRLGDWDIRHDPDPPHGKGCSAETRYHDSNRVVVLAIHPDVTGDQVERHVIHELMHVVMRDRYMLTHHVISKTGRTGLGIMDRLDEMDERLCELMAEAITGTPWEPLGKVGRKHFSVFANHTVTDSTGETA